MSKIFDAQTSVSREDHSSARSPEVLLSMSGDFTHNVEYFCRADVCVDDVLKLFSADDRAWWTKIRE